MEGQLTDDQRKDITERTKLFLEEYNELVKKHSVDFISYPEYVPTSQGLFLTRVLSMPVDTKYRPVPSPINDTVIKNG